MRDYGVECAPLKDFARELAAAFLRMPAVPRQLAVEAYLSEALANCENQGGCKESESVSRAAIELPCFDERLLLADRTTIESVTREVSIASLFGSRVASGELTTQLSAVLQVILLQKLQDYDLMLGAALLRAIKCLGLGGCEEARYAIAFLLSQQHMDGRFGYYARELREVPLENPDLDLYLPVTVSVLWAVVEMTVPGFCLLGRRSE
jgi:hypothetical protein